jgi:hypothetical protein
MFTDAAKADRIGLERQRTLEAQAPPKADGGGLRYNADKVRLELIPPDWFWALGQVLTRGAIKYDTRNWERGMPWSTMIGCSLRHIVKFMCGERYDPETGCHHLAHAAWNCLALMTYDIRKIGQNDLDASALPSFTTTAMLDDVSGPMGEALAKIAEEKRAKAAAKK